MQVQFNDDDFTLRSELTARILTALAGAIRERRNGTLETLTVEVTEDVSKFEQAVRAVAESVSEPLVASEHLPHPEVSDFKTTLAALSDATGLPQAAFTGEAPDDTALTDSAGEVWDADKHASTKTKTKDGRWKLKRGATTAADAEREVELLAEEQARDLATPPRPPAAAVVFGGVPVPPVPAPAADAPPATGAEFAERFQKRVAEGKTTYVALMPILKAEGFDLYPDLISRGTPEQLAAVWGKL